MNRNWHTLLLAMGLALAGNAAADDSGWFLERAEPGAGAALLMPRDSGAVNNYLALGAGYRFSDLLSVRASVDEFVVDMTHGDSCADVDFACVAARSKSVDYGSGYRFSLVPTISLHDDLAIYGHLGLQDWNVQVSADPSLRRKELLFGIGLGYDVTNPLRVQLEYRSMDLDIKLTSIGFTWRF